ncbi:MAG: DUF58 domain-containing protein [Pseudoxanthomonas sp.]
MSTGVTPDLAELVALRGLAQRRGTAKAGRVGMSGPAPSTLRGRGMEYAESREYVTGDDARHIDWRLTARSGRTHTKLFQAERERLTLLVADTSPHLYFGTRTRFKSVQAARAAAVLTWAAVAEGDRVAALRGATTEAPVPPAQGTRGALRVLDALRRWYAEPPSDDAGLGQAIDRAFRMLRPGARLLVVADAASLGQISQARWTALAAYHQVGLVLLTDALEQQPPKSALPFWSGRAAVDVDLGSSGPRQQWRHRFATPVAQALEQLPRRGISTIALATDAPVEQCLSVLGRQPVRAA